jgi:hypothetical protein
MNILKSVCLVAVGYIVSLNHCDRQVIDEMVFGNQIRKCLNQSQSEIRSQLHAYMSTLPPQSPVKLNPTDNPFFNDVSAASNLQNLQPSGQDDTYGHYLELVLADCVGFYQITNTIFVVQGWDMRGNVGSVSIHS